MSAFRPVRPKRQHIRHAQTDAFLSRKLAATIVLDVADAVTLGLRNPSTTRPRNRLNTFDPMVGVPVLYNRPRLKAQGPCRSGFLTPRSPVKHCEGARRSGCYAAIHTEHSTDERFTVRYCVPSWPLHRLLRQRRHFQTCSLPKLLALTFSGGTTLRPSHISHRPRFGIGGPIPVNRHQYSGAYKL